MAFGGLVTLKYRLLAGTLVFLGCSWIGFKGASLCQAKKNVIESFLHLLEHMIIELSCHVTPLPELCRIASGSSGVFRKIMGAYSESLETQIAPDPVSCMERIEIGAVNLVPGNSSAASRCLRKQADLMMAPYCMDAFSFWGV